jgi:hypothetical protein
MRVRLEDSGGHSLEIVLTSQRTMRIGVGGPDGPVLRGRLDSAEIEAMVDLLGRHGPATGVAGRFHVLRQVPGDCAGYVDWCAAGTEVVFHPNRRGPVMDWCAVDVSEVTADLRMLSQSRRQRPSP